MLVPRFHFNQDLLSQSEFDWRSEKFRFDRSFGYLIINADSHENIKWTFIIRFEIDPLQYYLLSEATVRQTQQHRKMAMDSCEKWSSFIVFR